MIREPFAALQRVTKIAAAAGADKKDIALAKTWPLFWVTSIIEIHKLTPLAEIGRKVSSSRDKQDSTQRMERDIRIMWRAIELLKEGAPTRGLASRIRSDLKLEISVRHINRILDTGMAILFKS